ncbi:hypothetical protein K439DRAFT_518562 [Ramaria rubella]|nr:hypothetical protein K439DRAFT_518562 [Ramaria rubella]
MASTSSIASGDVLFPKPPSPGPLASPEQQLLVEIRDGALPPNDPPPPYPLGPRSSRRGHTTIRSTRRSAQASDDSQTSDLPYIPDNANGGESESSPLLGSGGRHGRRRTLSHSSTTHSVHSIAQTVLSSSRTVISLFQAEPDSNTPVASADIPFFHRLKRYFRPMGQKRYYAALFHLLFVNFPYELGVWIYLFVGTLSGTTLLITLPLGLIICFLDLLGARVLARGEIALQTRFHGPLSIFPPNPPHPIFSRMRAYTPDEGGAHLEHGRNLPSSVPETSFLRLSFLMFRDPTSYQALFYFLVIKPGLTLLITIALIVLVPPAFILLLPAPAVLRAVRRVGIWQAEVAIDALS